MKLLRKILNRNNFNIKILSLLIAIMIWSYVMGIENPQITSYHRGISVQAKGEETLNSKGLVLEKPFSAEVSVQLSATKAELSNIRTKNIVAEVDLSDLESGESRVPVHVSIHGQSGKAEIKDVEPSSIIVNVEKIVSKNLPIEVKILGTIASGYVLEDVKPVFGYVRVTGPESAVANIKEVTTYADITGKTKSFTINSDIEILDENGVDVENIQTNNKKADINVTVYKSKAVTIEPIFSGKLGENQVLEDVEINPSEVVIKGPEEKIDSIVKITTNPIEYENLKGSDKYAVTLNLPTGIFMHDGNEKIVMSYNLKENIEKTLSVPSSLFEVRNRNEEFEYNVKKLENFLIVLYGDAKILENIGTQDVKPYVDVSGLGEGEYTLDVKIDNDKNLNIQSINPNKIRTNITPKD